MALVFCRGCGTRMTDTAAFCPGCGAPSLGAKPGYFSFEGRVCRRDYWLNYVLPIWVGSIILDALVNALFGANAAGLGVAITVVCYIGSLAAGVKRCHDRGRSGWFLLVGFIPLIGQLWLLIDLGLLRGEPGPNRFGPDPLPDRAGFRYRGASV